MAQQKRTLSNLYSIALDYYKGNKEHYESSGLCYLISNLHEQDVFTESEASRMRRSIKQNKPTKNFHKEHFHIWSDGMRHIYWWPIFTTHHRIAFLEKMITYIELPWYVRLWDKLK